VPLLREATRERRKVKMARSTSVTARLSGNMTFDHYGVCSLCEVSLLPIDPIVVCRKESHTFHEDCFRKTKKQRCPVCDSLMVNDWLTVKYEKIFNSFKMSL
jgi:hypothetical protein